MFKSLLFPSSCEGLNESEVGDDIELLSILANVVLVGWSHLGRTKEFWCCYLQVFFFVNSIKVI